MSVHVRAVDGQAPCVSVRVLGANLCVCTAFLCFPVIVLVVVGGGIGVVVPKRSANNAQDSLLRWFSRIYRCGRAAGARAPPARSSPWLGEAKGMYGMPVYGDPLGTHPVELGWLAVAAAVV